MNKISSFLYSFFVVIVNFYFLTFFLGILLMFCTIITGSLNTILVIIFVLLTMLISITYHLIRKKFSYYSIGEIIINNSNKNNITIQNKHFTISRIPLFLLIIATLMVNGHLQDGLAEDKVFSFGSVVFYFLIFLGIYYGIKNFCIKSEIIHLILISGSLLLVGTSFKYSPNAIQTRDIVYTIYLYLAIAWIIIGLIYINFKNKFEAK